MKIFATLLVFLWLFPSVVVADIHLSRVEVYPGKVALEGYILSNPGIYKVSDEVYSAVKDEVYNLTNKFSVLERVDFKVFTVNQQLRKDNNLALGLAGYQEAFLFAYNGITKERAMNTLDHEMGHLLSRQFVTSSELLQYAALRQDGEVHNIEYYDTISEVFAEDFRWLFGSVPEGKDYGGGETTYSEPGEKEKEWILNQLLTDWRDRLNYYKSDNAEGLKEISRTGDLYNERKARKDFKGAESAHRWANQVRTAIGVPVT